MTFRGFDPVNGAPVARRRRRSKTIDRVETAERGAFHEVDGAPRQTLAAVGEMRPSGAPGRQCLGRRRKRRYARFCAATDPGAAGCPTSRRSAVVNGLPSKALKLQRPSSSKGLTKLDET
jgi:hypothetical protein